MKEIGSTSIGDLIETGSRLKKKYCKYCHYPLDLQPYPYRINLLAVAQEQRAAVL